MRSFLEEFACGGIPEPDRGALVVLWAYFDESGTDGAFPTPYSLCFEMMIQLLRTDIAPIEGLPVAIIMSDQAQFEPRAQEIYKHYKHAGLCPEIVHLGYSDPRVVLPLQAADMLAFETRRFCWKEQEDYWKEQPLLSRWLNLTYRWQRATYSVAFDDDGLDFFLSQEKGQYLKTPSSLGETRAAAPGPENV